MKQNRGRGAPYHFPKNYRPLSLLGQGGFGAVFKCIKVDSQETVAVKVPHRRFSCKKEVALLKFLMWNNLDKCNIVRFNDSFTLWDLRTCLVFEMLDVSLRDCVLHQGKYNPLDLHDVRSVIQQMATALNALKTNEVIHSDIKLDNIMLVDHQSQPLGVKLIDFGMAFRTCKARHGDTHQIIPYRAPEIILGLPFSEAIDMWSLGIVMAFIVLGVALFPVRTEYDAIRCIVDLLGVPPAHLLKAGRYSSFYFVERRGHWKLKTPDEYWTKVPSCKDRRLYQFRNLDDVESLNLKNLTMAPDDEKKECIDLLKAMLQMDANERITPSQVLAHPFITRGTLSVLSQEAGTGGTAEPGTSGTTEPGTSGTAKPGTSGTAKPETSGTAKPGTSGTTEPGTRGTAKPGTRGTTEPGTSGTAKPGTSGTTEPGTRGTAKPGTRGTTEPETSGTAKPGTSGTTEPGTRGTAKPGTRGTTEPGTSRTAKPGTSGTAKPGTRGTTEPGTRGTTEPGTRGTAKPGTRGTTEPGTRGTAEPGTTQANETTEIKTDDCDISGSLSEFFSAQLPQSNSSLLWEEENGWQHKTCSSGTSGFHSCAIMVQPAPPECCLEWDEDSRQQSGVCPVDCLEENPEGVTSPPTPLLPEGCNMEEEQTELCATPDDKEPKKKKKKKKNIVRRFFGWMKKTFYSHDEG
ncbi:uncharacterized protein [Pempheris klunzingeri]|uniref:uncharacterized protein isoform X2 n=1 Tax=Pempheris klunzingeri TaxID=3127111 RepID=UPI00397FA8D0